MNNTIELRINQQDQKIYLAGYLAINEFSEILMDKDGRRFREKLIVVASVENWNQWERSFPCYL